MRLSHLIRRRALSLLRGVAAAPKLTGLIEHPPLKPSGKLPRERVPKPSAALDKGIELCLQVLPRRVLHSNFVHVPQPSDWKPASVGAMVTIDGLLVPPLAIMLPMPPLKPLSLS